MNVSNLGLKALKFAVCKFLQQNLEFQDKFNMIFPGIESKKNYLLSNDIRKKQFLYEEEEYRSIFEFQVENSTKDFVGKMIA